MENNCLLSICIPTYKRPEIIDQLLDSIYRQNVDHSIFEVCITDNSETDETKNVIEAKYKNIDNLRYKKTTCKGFLNSMEALKFGKGELLKLHNDYSVFVDDSLQDMINIARKYSKEKPEIFFSLNSLKNKDKIKEFSTFNDFLNDISYYSTWSSAFSIWKEDFDDLMNKNISYDNMFPHTSLLFNLVEKEKYVVDDNEYAKSVELKKKGGYNVVDNFVRIYLSMVRDDLYTKGFISKTTYNKIINQTIIFVAKNYRHFKDYSDKYTFSYDDKEKIIRKQCGIKGVILFYIGDIIYLPKSILIKLLRILNLEQSVRRLKNKKI